MGIVPPERESSNYHLPLWLPFSLLILAILLIFYRLLLGEVIFWGLPALQFFPWRDFAMSEFAQGRFPLWNPYNGAGAPLLANYQSAIFYPPHVLYVLFNDPRLMGWLGMLHILWAGIGMWLFSGRLGLPAFARAVAMLSFALCNTLLTRFGTIPMLDVAAWLPWLLLATDLVITQVTLRRWLLLAAVLTCMLLAGHAQWTFYSLILAGSFGVWQIATTQASMRKLMPVLVAGLFALLLCAVQLLPTAELQRVSQRADRLDEEFALNFSYAPVSLITMFNPDFFGNPGDGSYVIGGAYFETALYIGLIPMLFALIGLVRAARYRQGCFFALITVIAVLLATGRYLPLYPLLYRYLPTFNLFQAPSRWLLLAAFTLPILAAYGAAAFEATYKIKRRLRLLLAGGIGLAVVAGGALLLQVLPDSAIEQMGRGAAWLGVVIAIAGMVLLSQPKAESPRRLRWQVAVLMIIVADLWLANRLSNPVVEASFYTMDCSDASTERTFLTEQQERQLRDTFMPFDDYTVTERQAAEFRCSGLPNFNLLDRAPSLNNFDPLRPQWYEEMITLFNANPEDARLSPVQRRQIDVEGTAEIVEEHAQQITMKVSAKTDTTLTLPDTWYPGWNAAVDGEPVQVFRTDTAFRLVQVPAGEHTIVMKFEPLSFKIGALISLAALALFILLLIPALRRV